MNKQFVFLFLFLFSWISLSANVVKDTAFYVIKGHVVEFENKRPVSFATVRLLQMDSTFVSGTRTDEKGDFCLSPKMEGNYFVMIDYLGCEALCNTVIFDGKQFEIDLDTLVLLPKATVLKNMEVVAARSQIDMRGDTLVYNADAFRVPPGATLGTLLSRLPGITIEDGVVKYHGKEVNKLLINGKEFFLGDISVALENLPTEIVESIQAYETKTDEDKQKRTDNGEREMVLNVVIKKEYMSTWIGNTDLAAGTYDHYSGRLFLTRFTDRLSVSAFGQINNLNDQSEATPSGGWKTSKWTPGLNTFRKMGVNAAWDNGKKEEEAGYLKVYGSASASHNNYNTEQEVVGETFYPGASRNYSNNLNNRKDTWTTVGVNAGVTWQIDSMTNVFAKMDFSHNDQNFRGSERAATFNADPYKVPGVTDPIASVFSEQPGDSLLHILVNSNDMSSLKYYNSDEFSAQFAFGRRLSSKGHRLNLWTSFRSNRNNDTYYSLSDIRYYNQQVTDPQRINNQHSLSQDMYRSFNGQISYEHVLTKQQRLSMGYIYSGSHSQNDYTLYQLDSLDTWSNTMHPIGSLPSADSLAMVINWRNSTYATYDTDMHGGFLQYNLSIPKKFYLTVATYFNTLRTQMDYKREALDTIVVSDQLYPNPFCFAKYQFKGEGYIQFQYYGFRNFPGLTQMLDITDDRNPLVIVKGNPDLKPSWTHAFYLQFQKTFGKRKTSLWANAGYRMKDTQISNTETYDAVTGIRIIRPENVDGAWSTHANTGGNIPLDEKQRLNFSPAIYFNYSHNVGFFTSSEDHVSLLNEQTNLGCTPHLNLNYRLNGLYLATSNYMYIEVERNSLQPGSNQTSRTLNTGIEAQYEFPFGLTLSTDFHLYSCRGFSSPTMNNDQWLWNASVSQSFLKKKNMVVVVEAKDLLAQRLCQWSSSNTYGRSTTYDNMFRNMNYVMFHLIYRFSIGKKAT